MAKAPEETIFGGPTKRFFVSMLTRDIALEDAILDLVDNCVDGATRQAKRKLKGERPYEGFGANLTISSAYFSISDNCGGIPKDAIDDAFLLGRPKIEKDNDIPTIGVYGIGMKRAIFKIGRQATVESNSTDGHFKVTYSKEWLHPENNDWNLPIERSKGRSSATGVKIEIDKVHPEIGRHLGNVSFQIGLKNALSGHFGYLIQKGFAIKVNGEKISGKTLQLFAIRSPVQAGIRPYDFETEEDDVHIRVTVGFFRPLVRDEEIEEEATGPRERDQAGISVICNDRLVLLNDTSIKTGWGDGSVPKYHPQFRSIAGFIIFSSLVSEKLPISTTKRDLDFGSEVFLKARQYCMEGLREFTDFTNKWKGMEEQTAGFFQEAKRVDARTEARFAAQHGRPVRGNAKARKLSANLPMPEKRNPRRRISYLKKESEIATVSNFLFNEKDQHPSVVGQECFDLTLARARKK